MEGRHGGQLARSTGADASPRGLPLPPPSPPPPPSSGPLSTAATVLIATVGSFLVLCTVLTAGLIVRSRMLHHDDVERRGVRRFSFKELEQATESFSRRLGEGGFGEVFAGTLGSTGEAVAVKRGKSRREYDDRGFRNEVKLLSSVHHRHLVALLGYCLHRRPGSQQLLLVYEFVERGSLEGILQETPTELTWGRRVGIALGAALGLDYLHSQISPPIIHRDIKSANILVTGDYQAKVADFGVSLARPLADLGATSLVRGTRAYLDLCYLRSGVPTVKSDVYSFGVVLLELLTGKPPVSEEGHVLQWVVDREQGEGCLAVLAPELRDELVAAGGLPPREPPANPSDPDHLAGLKGGDHKGGDNKGGDSKGLPGDDCGAGEEKGPQERQDPQGGVLSAGTCEAFLRLALKCCSSLPSRRPSMYVVADALEGIEAGLLSHRTVLSLFTDQVPFPEFEGLDVSVTEMLAVMDSMDTDGQAMVREILHGGNDLEG